MKKIFHYIADIFKKIFTLSKNRKMDSKFENNFLEEIRKHITPLDLSIGTELSVYKNNLVNSMEIKFSKSNNCYIVIVFKFENKHMSVNVGDMSGGDIDIVEFKTFFEGVFNIISKAYFDMFATYRLSNQW